MQDIDTGKMYTYTDDLKSAVNRLQSADLIIGHNIIGFDIPVIKKFFPSFKVTNYLDTYILAQLLYPNIKTVTGFPRKHSLGAWGKRLRFPKIEFDQYDVLSDEMIEYCEQDVRLNTKLYFKFKRELDVHDWSKAIQLEQEFYRLITANCKPWPIDVEKLDKHIYNLTAITNDLKHELTKLAPKQLSYKDKPTKAYKKDGLPTVNSLKDNLRNVCGDYTRIHIKEINLNSHIQVKDWLFSLGWKPDSFTYETDENNKPLRDKKGKKIKKSPSISKSNFVGVPEEIASKLQELNIASHRLNVMRGWRSKVYKSRLKGNMQTCGCNTARVKHGVIANLPRAEDNKFYGSEMRSVFITDPGLVLLGIDLSQIEARVEGHFTYPYDNGEYAEFLLSQDIHQFNADLWGISRTEAKSPQYAMQFRCAPAALVEQFGWDEQVAKKRHKSYWDARKAAQEMFDDICKALRRRGMAEQHRTHLTAKPFYRLKKDCIPWILGIDGRKLWIRALHSSGNTLIQSTAAILAKAWTVKILQYIEQNIDKHFKKARLMIFYHDENQIQCLPQLVNELSQVSDAALKTVKDEYNFRIDLEAEVKTGSNWAETH